MIKPAQNYHELVADSIIRQLEKGIAPWVKPWQAGEHFMPYNPTTGNNYRGVNAVWLMTKAEIQGYSDTRWLTYKQATGLDVQVGKGEKGTLVEYYKWQDEVPVLDENGKPKRDEEGKPLKQLVQLQRPRVFRATVFNGEQINGLPDLQRPGLSEWERHNQAEAIIQESGAVIQHLPGNRAFYRPSTDSITLPLREQFPSADNYYATALHELGHWTGHESRLNRDLQHPFGSEAYAKEELRAEIASMMLGEQLSIGHDPTQHVAYIGSWIKALQEDPREIFRASADAEKILKYLNSRELQQEQTQAEGLQIQIPVLALEEESVAMRTTPDRVYLDVPYGEKEEAKALGARWDRAEKSWYVPVGIDPDPLQRWAPSSSNVHLTASPDPKTEFAEALRTSGLILDGAPVMDGELRRVRVEGDQPGEKSGSYVGFSDGHPAGYIQNYKIGYQGNWKASTRSKVLNAKDRARLDAEAAEKRTLRSHEREVLAEESAKLVEAHWRAGKLTQDHPYLTKKGVNAYGLRTNTLGALALSGGKADETAQHWSNNGELLIPVVDIDGQLWAAQSIDDTGRKSFPRGSKLQGGHHLIGDAGESDEILIAEGYATGATLHELTGLPVAVAFHAGNLPAVAEAFREKYPQAILILAGDNDHSKPNGKNVGRLKSQEAAQKVGGHTLLPDFGKNDSGTDWNDLVKQLGKGEVQLQLQRGLKVAIAKHQEQKREQAPTIERTRAQPEKALVQSGGRSISR